MTLSDFQRVIYEQLDNAVLIGGEPVPVFDDTPQGQPTPYITIGEIDTATWSSDEATGREVDLVIHTFSQEDGRKESQSMIDQIISLLDRATLDGVIGIDFESTNILPDPDGVTRHGVCTFTALYMTAQP